MKLQIIIICLVAGFFLGTSVAYGVYGGEPLDSEMRKSLVNIKFKFGPCSGVLIAPNVVVTAAHCRDMSRDAELVAWLDGDHKKDNSRECDVTKVVDHAYFPGAERIFPRRVHSPDLVLLKLESSLCSARPAIVQSDAAVPGDLLLSSGYGGRGGQALFFESNQIELKIIETPINPKEMTTTKQKIFLDLLDLAHKSYQFALPARKNETVCSGDSGGPVFKNQNGNMLLYGVNGGSFPHSELGADRCDRRYLHVITPMAPYHSWIQYMIDLWAEE